jgi:hypothetical protein
VVALVLPDSFFSVDFIKERRRRGAEASYKVFSMQRWSIYCMANVVLLGAPTPPRYRAQDARDSETWAADAALVEALTATKETNAGRSPADRRSTKVMVARERADYCVQRALRVTTDGRSYYLLRAHQTRFCLKSRSRWARTLVSTPTAVRPRARDCWRRIHQSSMNSDAFVEVRCWRPLVTERAELRLRWRTCVDR